MSFEPSLDACAGRACCSLAARAEHIEGLTLLAGSQQHDCCLHLNLLGSDRILARAFCAGIMDGHGMPPNIIDPAGGGNSTRITLAHH